MPVEISSTAAPPKKPDQAAFQRQLKSVEEVYTLDDPAASEEIDPKKIEKAIASVKPDHVIEKAEPEPTPAPANEHPEWLQSAASALGISEIIVETLGTDQLKDLVLQQALKERTNQPNQKSQAVPVESAPQEGSEASAGVAEPQFDWGIFDDFDDAGRPVKRKYTDEDISPAIAHHIKKQNTRIEQLENFIKSLGQQAQASQEMDIQKQFDKAFDSVPQLFGSGDANAMRGKPEFQRRVAIYNVVKSMFAQLPKGANMTIQDAVEKATKEMFGIVQKGEKAKDGMPDYESGQLAKPTQRIDKSMPLGKQRAVQAVKDYFKEHPLEAEEEAEDRLI